MRLLACLAAVAATLVLTTAASAAPVSAPAPPVGLPSVPGLPPGAEPHPGSPPPPRPASNHCRAAWVMPLGRPGRGVSKTALGPARWAYEVGYPAGRFAGRRPRGIMLLIHGGGWYIVGPGPLST